LRVVSWAASRSESLINGVPVVVLSLNGLHNMAPAVPEVPLLIDLNVLAQTRPWNEISAAPVFVSFAAMWLFYLLPVEFLFSLWFFLGLTRVQEIIAAHPDTGPGQVLLEGRLKELRARFEVVAAAQRAGLIDVHSGAEEKRRLRREMLAGPIAHLADIGQPVKTIEQEYGQAAREDVDRDSGDDLVRPVSDRDHRVNRCHHAARDHRGGHRSRRRGARGPQPACRG